MNSLIQNTEPRRPALFRLPAVCAEVGLSESHVRALARDGDFPKPLKIGKRAVAWRSDDLFAWIAARAAERDQAATTTVSTPVAGAKKRAKAEPAKRRAGGKGGGQ